MGVRRVGSRSGGDRHDGEGPTRDVGPVHSVPALPQPTSYGRTPGCLLLEALRAGVSHGGGHYQRSSRVYSQAKFVPEQRHQGSIAVFPKDAHVKGRGLVNVPSPLLTMTGLETLRPPMLSTHKSPSPSMSIRGRGLQMEVGGSE